MIQRIVFALLFGLIGVVGAAVVAFVLTAVADYLGDTAALITLAVGATGAVGALLVDLGEDE